MACLGELACIEGVEDKVYGGLLQGEHEGDPAGGPRKSSVQSIKHCSVKFIVCVVQLVHSVHCIVHDLTRMVH